MATKPKTLKQYLEYQEPYYYWDETYQSNEGKTLQECFDAYGTGTQKFLRRSARMEVIFLDATRDFGNSWMLRCYHTATGENIPVTLYEPNKIYGQHKLNPK